MMAANKNTLRKLSVGAILLLLLLALVGCGGSDKKAPVATPVRITATPRATTTRTPVPTWTPSVVPTQAETPTPGPTFTPRPSDSPTPQPVTGAQRLGENQFIVTVLEPDLNVSIANLYQARALTILSAAPTITMRQEGWLEAQFSFQSEFSGSNKVTALIRLGVSSGLIQMSESRPNRQVQGAMIDDNSMNTVLDLILQSVNDIVVNLVPAPAGSYQITAVESFPGFLRVTVSQ